MTEKITKKLHLDRIEAKELFQYTKAQQRDRILCEMLLARDTFG